MTKWIMHWRSLPTQNKVGAAISLVVLIACFITLAIQICDLVTG